MKRWLKITVCGVVQGVGYCAYIKKYADQFHIEGTVQSEEQGKILVYAVGASDALDNFIDYLYQATAKAVVEELVIEIVPPVRDYRGVFRIISGD